MATWQAAEPGSVIGDGKGNYQIRVAGQWTPMPKGSLIADEHGAYHFDSSAITPAAAPAAQGSTPAFSVPPAPSGVTPSPGEPEEHRPLQDAADMLVSGLKNIPHALKGMLDSAKAHANPNPDIIGNAASAIHTITHPTETLTSVGNTLSAATPEQVGANVVAPLLAGGVVGKAAGLAGETAAAPSAAETTYGFRTGQGQSIAKSAAGSSARPAVTAHNQALADPILGAQAGVPTGTKLTPKALADARVAPNSVYQRVESSLPTGPLSDNARSIVEGVQGNDLVVRSPDVQRTVELQQQRLLNANLSGKDVVDTQRALRFNGFANAAAQDPEKIALGKAQLKMADALHQHILDTLPANAPVTADQLVAARRALAQNHTVENFLKGTGNIDLPGLAKFHMDNPGLLSGPMADVADFAAAHPEVTALPSMEERFKPSGLAKDLESVDIKSPQSLVQPLVGAAARRRLTGPRVTPNVPVTGLAGEFGPPVPQELSLQPPPGTALEPHQPQLATGAPQRSLPLGNGGMTASPPSAPPAPPAGPPGQIPLADLLSHGVEQPPPEGLSLAQGANPVPDGIPFARDAAHEAGGLSLADQLMSTPHTYGGADLPHVMSQGVPEGTVARAPQPNPPRPKVAHSPALANNASLNNPASLEGISAKNEAVAKGTQPVAFGADDQEHPMSVHDIERRDLNPAPNSIFIDKKTGQIINSGRMAPRAAQALLARWKAIHGGGGLAEAF